MFLGAEGFNTSDKHMALGFLYVLTNARFPGLLKIGQSSKDPALRAAELRTTGVPDPFEVAYYGVFDGYEELERAVHARLSHHRHSRDREFFSLPLEEAVLAIRECARSAPLHEDLTHLDGPTLREHERLEKDIRETEARKQEALQQLSSVYELIITREGVRIARTKNPVIDCFEGVFCPQDDIGVFNRQVIRTGTMGMKSTLDGIICDQGGSWDHALLMGKAAGHKPISELIFLVYNVETFSYNDQEFKKGTSFAVILRGSEKNYGKKFLKNAKEWADENGNTRFSLSVKRMHTRAEPVLSVTSMVV